MTVEDNVIRSAGGKVLRRKSDGAVFGTELSLGYTYWIGGVKQTPPVLEKPEDYEDVTEVKVSDTESVYTNDLSYSNLKAMIVKLRYSYDDQIALMLNYMEKPEEYKERYDAMLMWRDVAGEAARMYCNDMAGV